MGIIYSPNVPTHEVISSPSQTNPKLPSIFLIISSGEKQPLYFNISVSSFFEKPLLYKFKENDIFISFSFFNLFKNKLFPKLPEKTIILNKCLKELGRFK